ncbi:hypothetical protein J2X07_003586 [Fictibacillus barbaricus]|uniref:Uncharacterized protein n=1 Tax=Fictibacillus barbaricus TaxID=182136 RepID=A0ABU1U523_9BACL|nr:hypothetical protein [Fictibacillus barbaricus]
MGTGMMKNRLDDSLGYRLQFRKITEGTGVNVQCAINLIF